MLCRIYAQLFEKVVPAVAQPAPPDLSASA
jgi:hypothetical protein